MNCKRIALGIIFIFLTFNGLAQPDRVGIFKKLNVHVGFTATFFHTFNGEYVYILQPNSTVKETKTNQNGASLSIVLLFPHLDKTERSNLLLNLSLLDIKSDVNLFNFQTPFGIGYAHMIGKDKRIGLTGIVNFGQQKKMYDDAINTAVFPTANYVNVDKSSILKVGAPVPQSILEPYLEKQLMISLNVGIVIRLD